VTRLPRIFVGSSSAAKPIVHALDRNLSPSAETRVWYHNVFVPSRTTLEGLDTVVRAELDGAVLVLTPDDMRDRGQGPALVARDNVIFELGLFMGALGRERSFGLVCRHCAVDLPTDLSGVTWVTYLDPRHGSADPPANSVDELEALTLALRPAAEEILECIERARTPAVRAPGLPDLVKAYPMRGNISRTDWNGILAGSREQIWLYGMAELGYADDDDIPGILQEAASRGCEIRILLLNPDHAGTITIDRDEGKPSGTIAPRIRASLARFSAMAAGCGQSMQIRVYDGSPVVSIVRGDQRMLVTPYVRFISGDNTPTFELHGVETNGLFDRYARHFEKAWTTSTPWKADA